MIDEEQEEQILYALEIFKKVSEENKNETICKLNNVEKKQYRKLLDYFIEVNSKKQYTDRERGKALEDLVTYLLKISGGIFEIKTNIHTSTNEIDQIITLNHNGKLLHKYGLINKRLELFLSECKNYNKAVGVTYSGKFCSLLITNNVKLGLMFSYKGLSGRHNWDASKGLIRKFYLSKENEEERFCILEFTKNDFEKIYKGDNLLQLINSKIDAMKLDTNYSNFLSKHPAES